MKILHVADTHAHEKNAAEVVKCLSVVEETARDAQVDLVVFAGDMWHCTVKNVAGSPLAEVVRIVERIATVCPVFILRGTPTHDVAGSLDVFKGRRDGIIKEIPDEGLCKYLQYPIWVIEEGGVKTIESHSHLIHVAAVPPFSQAILAEKMREIREAAGDDSTIDLNEVTHSVVQDFIRTMKIEMDKRDPSGKQLRIMVGHFEVLGSRISETQTLKSSDVKISMHDIDLAGVDCAMLGHIHFPQQIENRPYFYSGSTIHLNYGEDYDVGFWIHDIDGRKLIDSRFINTPSVRKYMIKANIEREEDVEILKTRIAELPDGAKYKVNVSIGDELRGVVTPESLSALLEEKGAEDTAVAIAYLPKDRARIESEALGNAKGLPDKFALYCKVNDEEATARRMSLVSSMEAGEGVEALMGETLSDDNGVFIADEETEFTGIMVKAIEDYSSDDGMEPAIAVLEVPVEAGDEGFGATMPNEQPSLFSRGNDEG